MEVDRPCFYCFECFGFPSLLSYICTYMKDDRPYFAILNVMGSLLFSHIGRMIVVVSTVLNVMVSLLYSPIRWMIVLGVSFALMYDERPCFCCF